MELSPELLRFARRTNGLVTLADWTASGRTSRSFHRAERSGLLQPIAPGVAALAGTTVGPLHRIHAEVLSVRAVASHRSAAFLWGACVAGDRPFDLITTTATRRVRRAGVVLHRASHDLGLHAVVQQHVRVTSPLRTLVDLGAVDAGAVAGALERFLIDGLVTVVSVRATLAGQRRRGRAGVGPLEQALGDLALGAKIPDSVLEPRMAELFRRHDATGWTFHAVVCGHEVDFAFSDARVVVEVDGFAYHADRQAFERDRDRDSELAASGWVVLRFTWRQVTRRSGTVGTRLRSTLDTRRPRPFIGHPETLASLSAR